MTTYNYTITCVRVGTNLCNFTNISGKADSLDELWIVYYDNVCKIMKDNNVQLNQEYKDYIKLSPANLINMWEMNILYADKKCRFTLSDFWDDIQWEYLTDRPRLSTPKEFSRRICE
jgi:hypothetical protein